MELAGRVKERGVAGAGTRAEIAPEDVATAANRCGLSFLGTIWNVPPIAMRPASNTVTASTDPKIPAMLSDVGARVEAESAATRLRACPPTVPKAPTAKRVEPSPEMASPHPAVDRRIGRPQASSCRIHGGQPAALNPGNRREVAADIKRPVPLHHGANREIDDAGKEAGIECTGGGAYRRQSLAGGPVDGEEASTDVEPVAVSGERCLQDGSADYRVPLGHRRPTRRIHQRQVGPADATGGGEAAAHDDATG